jgi:hypothetical protein
MSFTSNLAAKIISEAFNEARAQGKSESDARIWLWNTYIAHPHADFFLAGTMRKRLTPAGGRETSVALVQSELERQLAA